ncbi:response regulator transcription factor [Parasulfuritortus cantonensis]|uniref:Response regulator transcription factor n=1 Tax=Parasulfuritortus cantonensis TaxID=2528202 RepID=A0A4R1BLW2_9PROT|nr:response regulator transcription factor [Parasulfuritortus cantonensis]TCJ18403.1 response regulator transcription factor [Parasulfuritortus cantonensis]
MRILVIEDDEKIASFVVKGFRQAGHEVDWAADGDTGFARLREPGWEAAVVDIMLPFRDGLSLVRDARVAGIATPIIFLSAKREVDDRILGLQAGGDDYLVKPFAFSELLARVQALVRRATGVVEPVRLSVGDLEMDLVKRKVSRGRREIVLQPREFALLEYLMRHRGSVVSKIMLMEHVWDYSFDPETSVVETTVSRLRNKLNEGAEGQPELIRTVRGVGYVLGN